MKPRASEEDPVPYEKFRTGMDFATVRQMLWSPDPDPSTWRHKRRGTVLGLWHQIKRDMYAAYLDALESAHGHRLDIDLRIDA